MPADPVAQAVFDENVRRLKQLGIGDDKYAKAFLLGVKCAVLCIGRMYGWRDNEVAASIVNFQKLSVAEAERLRNLSVPLHPDAA